MCYVSMNAIREARPLHREVLSAVLMYFAIAELSEVSESLLLQQTRCQENYNHSPDTFPGILPRWSTWLQVINVV